jgi:oxygen-independent coproporphyrinogen-3 oxidase
VRASHLYIHVPFCARRCVYCDFSIAVRSRVPVAEYLDALDREWSRRHVESEFALETLYLGGGTPSKLGGDGVARLLDAIRARTTLLDTAEVTLEANPEDVTSSSAEAWRAAGVTRVSLGVQSFDDAVLRWMHRTHNGETAIVAIETLRQAGLSNVSIDLIFATPDNLQRSWARDLDRALELDLPHLSVYGLTVEEHTPLGRWVARRDLTEAPEEAFEAQFLEADERLTAAGLEHYEVSNYARTGFHSRHNWAYWRRRAYGGLGPSAHEFDGASRRWNVEPYAGWVAALARNRDPVAGTERLSEEQSMAERVYLGLRTSEGIEIGPAELDHVQAWADSGWSVVGRDNRLRLTGPGWLRLDAIANDLTLFRSRY